MRIKRVADGKQYLNPTRARTASFIALVNIMKKMERI
jgi:hypothetical protein